MKIYDGSVLLGTAVLDGKGGWTYSTTLNTGTHALRAVATDVAGNSSTSATQPAITVVAAPTVTIASQVLAHDTGLSATDGVTNDGAIKLSGTVAGVAGTTVQIFDGSTLLGTAALDGLGGWTYSTTLADGTHALHAVATDPSGNSTTTAAQSAITVDHTAPAVSYRYEYQVVGTNTVELFGNFTGPTGTKIGSPLFHVGSLRSSLPATR